MWKLLKLASPRSLVLNPLTPNPCIQGFPVGYRNHMSTRFSSQCRWKFTQNSPGPEVRPHLRQQWLSNAQLTLSGEKEVGNLTCGLFLNQNGLQHSLSPILDLRNLKKHLRKDRILKIKSLLFIPGSGLYISRSKRCLLLQKYLPGTHL